MVFCSKCGAILMGTVCSRCGGTNNAGDSKKESDNGESGREESARIESSNNPFSSGRPANSPFSGAGISSPFSSGASANSPFSGSGAVKSPFSSGGSVNSPFSGGAAKSPFSSNNSGNSEDSGNNGNGAANNPFGGSKYGNAFGFGGFGQSGFGNTSYGSEEDVAEKNKKSLISKLERYKEILEENEELDSRIKPQSSFPATEETSFKKRSFMKFFWPYLVGGIGGGYLLYFIVTMITMSSVQAYAVQAETDPSLATSRILGDTVMGMVLALVVAAAIIIFGIIISKRKQAEQNSKADYMNREASERYQKGLENQRMINLKQSNIQEMHQYESLVPNEFRTPIRIGKIIGYLKEDKAKTVETACDLIRIEPEPEPVTDSEPPVDLNGIFS